MAGTKSLDLEDAAWLAHRYDEAGDNFRFIHVPRAMHDDITFLSDEYLPQGLEQQIVDRSKITNVPANDASLHFIFHSGYCCSTLLVRALNQPGIATSFSEPTILRDIVGYKGRGAHSEKLYAILHHTLHLLARPFEPGEAVVVKPSCIVNSLHNQILAMRPDSQAVFLYAPIRVFLNSIARKGLTGRIWGRELFLGSQMANRTDLGFSDDKLFLQTDLQIAGLAWLIQNIQFTALLDEFGEERVRSLDSETFVSRPAEILERIGTLFGLNLGPDQASAIANSDVFRRHSKFGDDFDAGQREQERASGENAHADEIEKVAQWVESVAQGLNAAMTPGGNLMG